MKAVPQQNKETSGDLFSRPSDLPRGGGVKIADLEGALVIVKPEREEMEMETEFGLATVRPAKVLIVSGSLSGPDWQEILLFGAGLKAQAGAALRAGKPVVGVVGKGEAAKGKSAPWLFLDPSEPQLEAARQAYLATQLPF